MDDLSIIDRFLEIFTTFIDSGFGLLAGDVAFLTTALIAIDITLAGLFWAFSENSNIIAQLIKKVLYVGFFAFIIGNFAFLSTVIFESFSGLGLVATGSPISADDLMRPGFVADAGFDAARPLLVEASSLVGPVKFFTNFVTIVILLLAWAVVLVSFFVLAVQLFVTIIEFKLTTLAGFILIPFALWNKTTFLAERVLGNVVSAGVKLMVLTVIIGIGSTLFAGFATSFGPDDITIEQALSTALGAIAIFGLGIFGPGIASGLITGAPQLGAGAAAGAVGGVAAGAYAGAAISGAGARAAGAGVSSAVKAGASLTGGARTAFQLGKSASGQSGLAGSAAGALGVARAGVGAMTSGLSTRAEAAGDALRSSYSRGSAAAFVGTGGASSSGSLTAAAQSVGAPANDTGDWSKRFERQQNLRSAGGAAAHSIRDGDGGGSGAAPSLKSDEE
ncbi:MAG: P-type conjugative transfer protein TrbL [Pseudomonadota bacterium]